MAWLDLGGLLEILDHCEHLVLRGYVASMDQLAVMEHQDHQVQRAQLTNKDRLVDLSVVYRPTLNFVGGGPHVQQINQLSGSICRQGWRELVE